MRSIRPALRVVRFYHTSPDQLSEEQIRQYLLHLTTVQKVARGTHTIALCGIKFFYQHTLVRPWTVLDVARPKGEKKLPVVLSRDEVWRILNAVRIDAYRVCLTTIYACGLRLTEGMRLQVPDIDGDRTLLHIHGKRGKDRYVPESRSSRGDIPSTGIMSGCASKYAMSALVTAGARGIGSRAGPALAHAAARAGISSRWFSLLFRPTRAPLFPRSPSH